MVVAGVFVEVSGLLFDLAPAVEHRCLSAHLESQSPFHAAQRVDVLGLGAGSPRLAGLGQGHVGITAQRTFLHPHVGHPERADNIAQRGDVGAADLGRQFPSAGDGFGHDLDQRDPGIGCSPPASSRRRGCGRWHRRREQLAGVLLHVNPLDLNSDGVGARLRRDWHIEVSVEAQIGSSYWLIW